MEGVTLTELFQRDRAVLDTKRILQQGELTVREMKADSAVSERPSGGRGQSVAGTALAAAEIASPGSTVSVQRTEARRGGCRRTTTVSVTSPAERGPSDDDCDEEQELTPEIALAKRLSSLTGQPSPLLDDDGSTRETLGRLADLGPMPGAEPLDRVSCWRRVTFLN